MAIVINNTVNWLYSTFETKQQYYTFVKNVLPRVPNKRIHYIKKNKQTEHKDETSDNTHLIAKRLELSQREIKSYYEFQSNCTTSSSQS